MEGRQKMTVYKLQSRQYYREFFTEDSTALFNACWTVYKRYLNSSAIDNPACDDDVESWIDSIISEKVNNPNSQYYIYG